MTIQDGRTEILQSDALRLTEVFRREGAAGLVSYINARVGIADRRRALLLLADASLKPLAGNLPAWPDAVPRTPGTYTAKITISGHSAEDVAWVHAVLPGGYHLLVGRDIARFAPLEQRFWYALAGAVAHPVGAGDARRHPDPPRADGAHSRHPPDRVGHHPGRPESPTDHASQRR